jgi:hypothetical protein
MDYQEYLKSEHWLKTRQLALEFWDYRCTICKSAHQIEVHHNNYKCLGHETLSDLACLCNVCHSLFSMARRITPHEPQPIQTVLQKLQADYAAKHREYGGLSTDTY